MLVAHLSDLHLRDEGDAVAFAAQLDRIVARRPHHLVITGDLLDRWDRALLDHAIDCLAARGLLDGEQLTIIHGNHDLASSGGHPRHRRDVWRLIARCWDPPPLLAARRREFYRRIELRAKGVALPPGAAKPTTSGLRFATVDTVAVTWFPLSVSNRALTLRHAEGAIPSAQLEWLSKQRASGPLIVLVHHYPLPTAAYQWRPEGTLQPATFVGRIRRRLEGYGRTASHQMSSRPGLDHDESNGNILVTMEINAEDRARFWKAIGHAGAMAVLCGHVHRARLEHHQNVAIGLNGQSGAAWAGRTIAYYEIEDSQVRVHYESASPAA